MKNCVLFSPIGTTDPIRADYDGPMLHILRHFSPSKAILFLTSEMAKKEENSNMYTKFAKVICPKCELKLSKHNIKKANDFEIYIDVFEKEIRKLHEENSDATLLINISSGTPQMIAALCTISSTIEFPVFAIQVATPENSANTKGGYLTEDFNFEECMKNLIDNDGDLSTNRCKEVKLNNFVGKFAKERIKELINNYDYNGAYYLANNSQGYISKEALALIYNLYLRYNFDLYSIDNEIIKLPLPIGKERNLLEYYLIMRVKAQNEEISDCLIKISPILCELARLYLLNNFKFDVISKLCNSKTDKSKEKSKDANKPQIYISESKIETNFPQLHQYLCLEFREEIGERRYINFDFLLKLINFFDAATNHPNNKTVSENFENLRTVEKEIRNVIAHNIEKIDKHFIEKQTTFTLDKILRILEKLMQEVLGVRRDVFNEYKHYNTKIIKLL